VFGKELLSRDLFVNQFIFLPQVKCNQIKDYIDEWQATCNVK